MISEYNKQTIISVYNFQYPLYQLYIYFGLKKVLFGFSICYIDQFRYATSLQKTDGNITISNYIVFFSITLIYIIKYFL